MIYLCSNILVIYRTPECACDRKMKRKTRFKQRSLVKKKHGTRENLHLSVMSRKLVRTETDTFVDPTDSLSVINSKPFGRSGTDYGESFWPRALTRARLPYQRRNYSRDSGLFPKGTCCSFARSASQLPVVRRNGNNYSARCNRNLWERIAAR